jgi:N-acetylglucosamine-6-sulfatase
MVVFLGDSIFQWWDQEQFKRLAKFNPINFGISGYTTQNVLSFLLSTKLHNMKPDVIVILIGTNNSDHNFTTGETIEEIKEILDLVLEISPNSKIILLGILPRGASSVDRKRVFNDTVNKALKATNFSDPVFYADIGYLFLNDDSTISKEIMYDGLHLTPKGYYLLTEAVSSFITVLLEKSS